jgi:hypothetical protein
MADIIEFLTARFAETEDAVTRDVQTRLLRMHTGSDLDLFGRGLEGPRKPRRHSCVEEDPKHGYSFDMKTMSVCSTLRLLALPYASHSDYEPDWQGYYPTV